MNAERLRRFDEFYANKLKRVLFDDSNSIEASESSSGIRKVVERFEAMSDYNVPHGKKLRGLCVYESVLTILGLSDDWELDAVDDTNVDDRRRLVEQAKAIGWCIEFMQASFLIADDIMDNSLVRRGQPCWYLNVYINEIL